MTMSVFSVESIYYTLSSLFLARIESGRWVGIVGEGGTGGRGKWTALSFVSSFSSEHFGSERVAGRKVHK